MPGHLLVVYVRAEGTPSDGLRDSWVLAGAGHVRLARAMASCDDTSPQHQLLLITHDHPAASG